MTYLQIFFFFFEYLPSYLYKIKDSSQDANPNIFQLAFQIVDTHNDASWERFFTQLRNDTNLAIIYDPHPGPAR